MRQQQQIWRDVFFRDGVISYEGQKVLEDLARLTYAHRPANNTDPITIAHIEGMRSVYHYVTGILNLNFHHIENIATKIAQQDAQAKAEAGELWTMTFIED